MALLKILVKCFMVEYSPFYNSTTKPLFEDLFLPSFEDIPKSFIGNIKGIDNSNSIINYIINKANVRFDENLVKNINNKNCNMEPIMAARKIPIFPSNEQTIFFNKCFGACRFIYNNTLTSIKELYNFAIYDIKKRRKRGCIHLIKTNVTKIKGGSKSSKNVLKQCCNKRTSKYFCSKHSKNKLKYDVNLSFIFWRNLFVPKNSKLVDPDQWMIEIPHDTRQLVIRKLMDNLKIAIKNFKKGNIKSFDLKFRSKKDKKQYFFIDHRTLKFNGHLWPNTFNHPLKMTKNG